MTYRYPATVELEPVPLPAYADEHCPACNARMRMCETASSYKLREKERFCLGGRYGFLWLRKCNETRPHVHHACDKCGARWIVAPRNAAAYIGARA